MSCGKQNIHKHLMGLSFRGFDGSKRGLLTFHSTSLPHVFPTMDSAKRAIKRTLEAKKGITLNYSYRVDLSQIIKEKK